MLPQNKSLILYMSLLPVFLIIALIIGAGYFLMKDDFKLPKIFNNEPQVRRLEGFPTATAQTGVSKERRVIRSQTELDDFLKVVGNGNLKLNEHIDFEKEYILAASTETQNSGGVRLKVRKLYEDKEANKLIVSLRESHPGAECSVTMALNTPIDMVAISKTDKDISFEIEKVINNDCNDL